MGVLIHSKPIKNTKIANALSGPQFVMCCVVLQRENTVEHSILYRPTNRLCRTTDAHLMRCGIQDLERSSLDRCISTTKNNSKQPKNRTKRKKKKQRRNKPTKRTRV